MRRSRGSSGGWGAAQPAARAAPPESMAATAASCHSPIAQQLQIRGCGGDATGAGGFSAHALVVLVPRERLEEEEALDADELGLLGCMGERGQVGLASGLLVLAGPPPLASPPPSSQSPKKPRLYGVASVSRPLSARPNVRRVAAMPSHASTTQQPGAAAAAAGTSRPGRKRPPPQSARPKRRAPRPRAGARARDGASPG